MLQRYALQKELGNYEDINNWNELWQYDMQEHAFPKKNPKKWKKEDKECKMTLYNQYVIAVE